MILKEESGTILLVLRSIRYTRFQVCVYKNAAFFGSSTARSRGTTERTQKVDPPWGSIICSIGVFESRMKGSTFWILPGVWVCKVFATRGCLGLAKPRGSQAGCNRSESAGWIHGNRVRKKDPRLCFCALALLSSGFKHFVCGLSVLVLGLWP